MIIPIEIMWLFFALTGLLIVVGYMSRFTIPISMFLFVAGGLMFALFIMTEEITISYSDVNNVPSKMIYNVPNTLATADIQNGAPTGVTPIRAEYPSTSSSELSGDSFDCITVNIRKVNSPPIDTPVRVGIFDDNGNLVRQFGQNLNVTNITTDFFFYDFCLPLGESYTIGSLPMFVERIGIEYRDGDSTNRIQTRFDNTNPFDSTITFFQTWNGASWTSSTSNDLTMILTLRGSDNGSVANTFEFTQEIKTFMVLIAGIICLVGGAIEIQSRRN